jgi:hypothetical protein
MIGSNPRINGNNDMTTEFNNITPDVNDSELRMLQANLHKSKEQTHGILNDPDTSNYTALLLQEQFWSAVLQESPSHHSWLRYEPTSKDKPPRAVTYINKTQITAAQVSQIPLPFTDVVALQISPWKTNTAPILIVNVYNPCDESLINDLREELRRVKVKDRSMVVMAGDFNCHHPIWNPQGYQRHDNTADDLVELAAEFALDLLLPPGTITFPHAGTAIDLVWGCAKLQERLLKCQIAEQCDQGSDHCPVETIVRFQGFTVLEQPSYNIHKTVWPKFHEALVAQLAADIETPQRRHEIEERSMELVQALQTAIEKSTPLKRPCPLSKRWWTPELTALGRAQKSLKNRWRRSRTADDKQRWRIKANEYKGEIAKSKAKHWQKYISALDGKTVWDVKRYLEQTTTQPTIPTLENGAKSYEEIADMLSTNFFPQPPPACMQDLQGAKYPKAVKYKPIITIEQVRRAVSKTAPDKALGPDAITNRVLQQALPTIEVWLQKIVLASLNLGYFP